MMAVCVTGFSICVIGFHKGVERVTKICMVSLPILMILVLLRTIMLPNAGNDIDFVWRPDFERLSEIGIFRIAAAALNQSFFTLSVGCGAMMLLGSRANKERSLVADTLSVTFSRFNLFGSNSPPLGAFTK